jgi:hypothetical protein
VAKKALFAIALALAFAVACFAQGIRYVPPVRGVKIDELISSRLDNPQEFAFRAPKWGTYLSEIILKTVDDTGAATRIQTHEHIVLDFRVRITDPSTNEEVFATEAQTIFRPNEISAVLFRVDSPQPLPRKKELLYTLEFTDASPAFHQNYPQVRLLVRRLPSPGNRPRR